MVNALSYSAGISWLAGEKNHFHNTSQRLEKIAFLDIHLVAGFVRLEVVADVACPFGATYGFDFLDEEKRLRVLGRCSFQKDDDRVSRGPLG